MAITTLPNDIAIWTRLRQGEQDALVDLYNTFYVSLMNFGWKFNYGREDVRDSINQLFLQLWDKHHQLPAVQNVRSYLFTALRRELLARNKSAVLAIAKHQRFYDSANGEQPAFEECLIGLQDKQEMATKIKKALSYLSDREKELICFRFFEDLGYDEIAQRCGITKRTAYNIIHAGLNTLRKHLNTDERGNLFLVASITSLLFSSAYLFEFIILKKL